MMKGIGERKFESKAAKHKKKNKKQISETNRLNC